MTAEIVAMLRDYARLARRYPSPSPWKPWEIEALADALEHGVALDDACRHLEGLREERRRTKPGRPAPVKCLHKSCPRCGGTGRDARGMACSHAMACPCPRCRAGGRL